MVQFSRAPLAIAVSLACGSLFFGAMNARADGDAKKKKTDNAAADSGAKSKKNKDSGYQPPYGMAGCGLGSLVIKDDSIMQIFAATLNTTGYQTSAISSSHSSNCVQGKEDSARIEQQVFISANLASLEKDVSRGGGDYSYAFAQVLGCDAEDNYSEFLNVSRTQYAQIFSSSDPQVVYSHYLEVLQGNPRLVHNCERVIAKT